MGKINIFKGIGYEYETIDCTGKIKDILPEVDFSKCILLNSGNRIDSNYFVNEDDIIFLRTTPTGMTATAITMAVIAVVSAVAAIGTGIYAAIQNQKLQEEMENAQKQNSVSQNVKQLPFLKGAKNESALGKDIPFLMGEMYHTPYKITGGHYTLTGNHGETQYWHVCLSSGFSNQIIKSVSIGDVKIKDLSEETEPENMQYTFDPSVYSASDNFLEIRNSGEFVDYQLKDKWIANAYGEEIVYNNTDPEPTYLVKQLDADVMEVEVEIEFPSGLKCQYPNGVWGLAELDVFCEWSNDNGSTWHRMLFYQDDLRYDHEAQSLFSDHFKYATSSTMRYIASYPFDAEESYGKNIQIRLHRSKKSTLNAVETVHLGYIQTKCYDAKKSTPSNLVPAALVSEEFRDKETRIGLRIVANDSTKGELDKINIIAQGIARTWNGNEWSTGKTFTRNPAAWVLEILTSDIHPHSRFSDEEIDLESFGMLYEYCEEEKLYCDGIITKGTKKRDIIANILEECFSVLILNKENKLEVCLDRKENTPVALINSQCIKSMTVSKSFERQVDGKKVTFVNRDKWQTDTMYVMRNGTNYKTQEQSATEVAMNYATTPEHTWKVVQRQLLKASLQPRNIKVTVGKEGDYYPLFSVLKVQLPQMKIGGVSSVLHSLDKGKREIIIGDNVTFESDRSYGLIIQGITENGRKEFDIPVRGSGTTNILEISPSYDIDDLDSDYIEYGNIVSFGETVNGRFDKIVNLMKIYGITSSEDGVELELKDYSEEMYRWDKGMPIPEFKSNLSSGAAYNPPAGANVTYNAIKEQIDLSESLAKRYAESQIETAQLKGSPMYSANIDAPVIKKIGNNSYSPSVIGCSSIKTSFDEDGNPYQDPMPSKWVVTVNNTYERIYASAAVLNIDLVQLVEEIKSVYGLNDLELKNVRVVARSVLNDGVIWDDEFIPVIASDGGYVFELENEFQVYECYSTYDGVEYPNGYIKTQKETYVTPHLYNGLQPLVYGTDWLYDAIPPVPGFSVTLGKSRDNEGTLTITALEGADMEETGSIQIPVFIRSSKNIDANIGYETEAGEVTIGYVDSSGNEYTVGYIAAGEDSGTVILSFSWKKLTDTAVRIAQTENFVEDISDDNKVTAPEKKALMVTMDSIRNEHERISSAYSALVTYPAYNSAYTALEEYLDPILYDLSVTSSIDREEFNAKFAAYYSARDAVEEERTANPVYTYAKEPSMLPAEPHYGDYILAGFTQGVFTKGLVYTYRGVAEGWVQDDTPEKMMVAMDDSLSLLTNVDDDSIPSVVFCKKLIAMNAVIKNLASQVITLQQGGEIKSTTGNLSIKADGTANLNGTTNIGGNLNVKGNLAIEGVGYIGDLNGIELTKEGYVNIGRKAQFYDGVQVGDAITSEGAMFISSNDIKQLGKDNISSLCIGNAYSRFYDFVDHMAKLYIGDLSCVDFYATKMAPCLVKSIYAFPNISGWVNICFIISQKFVDKDDVFGEKEGLKKSTDSYYKGIGQLNIVPMFGSLENYNIVGIQCHAGDGYWYVTAITNTNYTINVFGTYSNSGATYSISHGSQVIKPNTRVDDISLDFRIF